MKAGPCGRYGLQSLRIFAAVKDGKNVILSHEFDWTGPLPAPFIPFMKLILVLIAISQFVVAIVPRALGWTEGVGARAMETGIRPELPPGLFFAIIWNVIFLLFLANAVGAARRWSYTDQNMAPVLIATGGMIVLWMLTAQFLQNIWLDLFLLFPVLGLAWAASRRVDILGGFNGTGERMVLCAVTGLLSGWITTAVSISIPEAAAYALGHGASDYVWRYLWLTLGCASLLAFVFTRWISRSVWYFVGLGWGLLGIAVNNLSRLDMPLLAYVTIAAGALIIYRRLEKGARGAAA